VVVEGNRSCVTGKLSGLDLSITRSVVGSRLVSKWDVWFVVEGVS
jgi:hypothetical protein